MKRQSFPFLVFCLTISISAQVLHGQASEQRPELVPQTGHVFPILKLAFSDDGKLLASASITESAVVLWDVENERQLRTFSAETGAGTSFLSGVRSLALSPNGHTLAVGTDSGVTVFNVEDGKELYHFVPSAQGFAASVGTTALSFSLSSRLLAALEGNSVQIWDMSTGNSLRTLPQQELIAAGDLAFSPDERTLAVFIYGQGSDGVVRTFDLANGNLQEHKLTGTPFILTTRSLAYGSNGHIMALSEDQSHKAEEAEVILTDVTTGTATTVAKGKNSNGINFQGTLSPNANLAAVVDGQSVKIIDLGSRRELGSFAVSGNSGIPFQYLATAFTPDQKQVVTGGPDGRIQFWEITAGQPVKMLEGHANFASAAVFAQDGTRLLTGARTQWDLNSGVGFRATPQPAAPLGIVSADGRLLASPDLRTGTIQTWNLISQKLLQTLPAPQDAIPSKFAFAPDGSVLAVSYTENNQDPAARQRNMTVMQQRMRDYSRTISSGSRKDPAQTIADYQRLVSGGAENIDAQIKIWNPQTGAELTTLKGHTEMVGALTFSADGKRLISVAKTEVRTWEVPSGRQLNTYQTENATSSSMGILASILPSQTYPNALAVSPDGQTIVVAEKKMVTEIDPMLSQAMAQMAATRQNTPQRRSRWGGLIPGNPMGGFGKKSQPVQPPRFDPSKGGIHIEGPLQVVNASSGELVGALPGHASGSNCVAFSPDGKLLASGGSDNVIRLWSMSDGTVVRELAGGTSAINALSFSPDGKLLASAANNGATHLWDVEKGEQLATLFSLNDGSDWMVVTPQGLFDGSPAAWNQILWRYGSDTFNVYPVEVFFNEFFYPGLLADIYAGKRPKPAVEIARIDRRQPEVKLSIENPSASGRTTNIKLQVSQAPASAQNSKGSGAKDLRLFRNGSLVKAWHGDLLQGQPRADLNVTVPLVAGENRFTAYAFNSDNVKSRDALLVIQGADPLRRPATTYVLAVGINEYANPDYNLRFAVADAQSFAEILKQRQQALPMPSRVEVTALFNQQATRVNILNSISEITRKALPEDHAVIFFASHGTAAKNRFYIIPHDLGYSGSRDQLDETAVHNILAHSISDLDLQQAFEPMDAAQIAVIIDACNSGQALEAEEKRRGPMNSKGLAQLAYEKGMYILTASQSYQAALEASQLGHGLLTYTLVEEGLGKNEADNEPKDGKIMLREWLDYATKRVPEFQAEKLQQARELRHNLSFGEAGKSHNGMSQYPKIFYRRELENNPWEVAEAARSDSRQSVAPHQGRCDQIGTLESR